MGCSGQSISQLRDVPLPREIHLTERGSGPTDQLGMAHVALLVKWAVANEAPLVIWVVERQAPPATDHSWPFNRRLDNHSWLLEGGAGLGPINLPWGKGGPGGWKGEEEDVT